MVELIEKADVWRDDSWLDLANEYKMDVLSDLRDYIKHSEHVINIEHYATI